MVVVVVVVITFIVLGLWHKSAGGVAKQEPEKFSSREEVSAETKGAEVREEREKRR